MIAVCLLTCDREQYTERTLSTFALHNQDAANRFLLLHADDGSRKLANNRLAERYGFETMHRSPVRTGGALALRHMWNEAARRGADRILHLENDWEWCGAVPEIEHDCVRLYGVLKGRGELHEEAKPIHMVTREMVKWEPHSVSGWERGLIHMGGPPSIVRTELLLPRIAAAQTLKQIGLFTLDTIRPQENIVWHIGAVTTNKRPC